MIVLLDNNNIFGLYILFPHFIYKVLFIIFLILYYIYHLIYTFSDNDEFIGNNYYMFIKNIFF